MLNKANAGTATIDGGESAIDLPCDDPANGLLPRRLFLEDPADLNSVLTSSLARLSGAADLREFLAHVMGEILRTTGAGNVAITRYDPISNQLHLELLHDGTEARWGPCGAELAIWAAPYDADITPAFRFGLQHPGVFVASMHADQCPIPIERFALPGGLEWATSIGVSDMAVSLLMAGENPVGTFHLHFTGGRILRRDDLPLLEALVQQAAIALRIVGMGEQAKESAIALERERAALAQQVQAKRINDFLSQTMVNLSNEADLSTVIESILVTFAKYLQAVHVFLFRFDPTRNTIRLDFSYVDGRSRWGMSGEEMALWAKPFSADVTPAWRIMCEQQGLFTPSMIPIPPEEFGWPGSFEYITRFNLSDVGHIVLFSGEIAVGSIGCGLRESRLTAADKTFVEAVAQQAAVAIRLVDLADEARSAAVTLEREQAAQERAAELAKANAALRRSSQLLAGDPDIDSFVRSVLTEAMNQVNARDGVLMSYRDGLLFTSQLVLEGEDHSAPSTITEGVDAAATPAWAKMLEKRSPIVWDVEHDAAMFWAGTAQFHRSRGTRYVVNAPMFVSDKPVGFFGLALRGDSVSADALELIQALADQAALAMQLSQVANADKEAAIARTREQAAEEKAVELARANAVITRGLRQLARESDLVRVPGTILMEICEQAKAEVCCWFDFDPEEETLRLSLRGRDKVLLVGPSANEPAIFIAPFPASVTPGFDFLLTQDDLVEFSAPENAGMAWPGVLEWHRENGRDAMLAYAVKVGDQPIGVVGMGLKGAVSLSRSQRELIRALANHLALAVHLSRLSEEASRVATLNERNRIARDIHDSMAQCFTGILMQVQAAGRMAERSPDLLAACVRRAEDLARSGLKQARRSVMSLMQDEEHYQDLGAALRSLVLTATADTETAAKVEVSGTSRTLHPLIAVNLLRICQEALGNAQRYAHAREIVVRLHFDPDALRLFVEDDGIGFILADLASAGYGLQGMRERAERIGAVLSILTAPGAGTAIRLDVPNGDVAGSSL